MWEITGISSLMKLSIVSARSKPTVEILATLLVGLQQYGTKPEAKRHPGKKYRDKEIVEYPISFKTLIERIPLIMENLESCKPSNKTTLLQRYFCGSNFKKRQKEGKGFILEEYIREHTFIMDYYKDFEIVFQPPTVKTLSDKIIIRHRGINGHFLQDNALNELLFQERPQEESVANPDEWPQKQYIVVPIKKKAYTLTAWAHPKMIFWSKRGSVANRRGSVVNERGSVVKRRGSVVHETPETLVK